MVERWNSDHGVHHQHPRGASRAGCLYEIVLREAIASQHGLTLSDRLELAFCEDCGKPYLLTSVWMPHSEEGAIACPRCGALVAEWDGARGYVAYWQREGHPLDRPVGGAGRGVR